MRKLKQGIILFPVKNPMMYQPLANGLVPAGLAWPFLRVKGTASSINYHINQPLFDLFN
jgi:hypothetical protein